MPFNMKGIFFVRDTLRKLNREVVYDNASRPRHEGLPCACNKNIRLSWEMTCVLNLDALFNDVPYWEDADLPMQYDLRFSVDGDELYGSIFTPSPFIGWQAPVVFSSTALRASWVSSMCCWRCCALVAWWPGCIIAELGRAKACICLLIVLTIPRLWRPGRKRKSFVKNTIPTLMRCF